LAARFGAAATQANGFAEDPDRIRLGLRRAMSLQLAMLAAKADARPLIA
jgi:hypothetical protein